MKIEEYLSNLNDQQRDAVCHIGSPSLVIAGAGSGKTRVLTYKIIHLLNMGYEPWRIMALTFTNKAAREMRERIEALVGAATASRLWMGTFHSIFARILRANADKIGFKSSFTIYDASDSRSLIKTIIKEMQLDDKIYKPAAVQNIISTAKNALVSPERYAADKEIQQADAAAHRPQLYEVYRTYRDRCFRSGAMDFDDLLYYTNLLLRDNPDIRERYREHFRYVLVDEYQDTNFAQHLIVNQLCQGTDHLCVVGDDAQSIYSFRGANIGNILNLRKSYPDLQTFKLERNYRSTRNIVAAANSLISKNHDQIEKNVYSESEQGSLIEVTRAYNDLEEATLVSNRIARLHVANGDSYENYAVLYRTNAQSRTLEEALRKRNIPYRIYGGLSFYQRKEVRDAIAYFRVIVNPDDDEALRRIINYPSRGIGETTLNKVSACAMRDDVSMWGVIANPAAHDLDVNKGTLRKLNDFVAQMRYLQEINRSGGNALVVAQEVYNKTGMVSMLLSDRTPESISRRENLNELLNGIKQFVEIKTAEGNIESLSISDFLGEVSLATDQDAAQGEEACVTLMTVHAAKGLEFDNVIVVGLEEELFPSAMAGDDIHQIEEERRLLYVAITRARQFCMLTFAANRFRNGMTISTSPSRFLADIDMRYLKMDGGRMQPYIRQRQSFSKAGFYDRTPIPPARPRPSVPQVVSNGPRPVPTVEGAVIHTVAEVRTGMKILHNLFGKGTILSLDTDRTDARITVHFDSGEDKVLMLKYARFVILE